MSNTGSFTLDMNDFMKNLSFIGKVKIIGLAEKGCMEAAWALKKDADEKEPKTPHLHGSLRGDAGSDVNIKPKITKMPSSLFEIAILVTYCAPYAARWHEAVGETIKWSEPGVGPKYLEAKMARDDLRSGYFKLIADRIKAGA